MTAPARLPTVTRLALHLRHLRDAGADLPQLCHQWRLAEGDLVCMRHPAGIGWTVALRPADPGSTGRALAEATGPTLPDALAELHRALDERGTA